MTPAEFTDEVRAGRPQGFAGDQVTEGIDSTGRLVPLTAKDAR
jgi:hypothetical protein